MVTHVGQQRVSIRRQRLTPLSQGGRGPASANFWDHLHARVQYEKRKPNFAW